MLQVIVPADDLNLLTIEELRVAVGLVVDDDSQDERLETLGLRVSAMIAAACGIEGDGTNPPTLLQESLTETLRVTGCPAVLQLSRRPVSAIISVTERGTTLMTDTEYEFDAASGRVYRLSSSDPYTWADGKTVIEYDAGLETVPDGLKALAAQLAGGYWADDGADPMEKSMDIPGVISTQRWVDTGADPQMPAEIMNGLISGGYVYRHMVL